MCVCVCAGFNSQSIFAVINNWSAGRRAAAAAGGAGGVKGLLHLAKKKKNFRSRLSVLIGTDDWWHRSW